MTPMAYLRRTSLVLIPLLTAAGTADASEDPPEIMVYSSRQEALIKPLLERFSDETGIRVGLVTGKDDALLQRLESEGINSPADVLMTADAGRLYRAKAAGSTRAVESETLEAEIPAVYRDPDGHWFGLTMRARPILYARDRVDPAELSTYEALAEPRFQGRICVRSSDNIYNQSLVASMIAAHGVEETEQWAEGLVANMARPPKGGDRDQIKAVAAGQCDIAIANTYYLAGMLQSKDPAQREAAEAVAVFWPNQDGRGTHVNVSGAAVTTAADDPEAAIRLIAFLASPESQAWYAEANGEYPIRDGIDPSPLLAAWGPFKADPLGLEQLGELNADAVLTMDRAGWR